MQSGEGVMIAASLIDRLSAIEALQHQSFQSSGLDFA